MSHRQAGQPPPGPELTRLDAGLGDVLTPAGGVPLDRVLALPRFKGVTAEAIETLVANCPKRRFELFLAEKGGGGDAGAGMRGGGDGGEGEGGGREGGGRYGVGLDAILAATHDSIGM